MDPKSFHGLLRLGFAQTYLSAQGKTCVGSVGLHECAHRCFSAKHLRTGLSRATSTELISMTF